MNRRTIIKDTRAYLVMDEADTRVASYATSGEAEEAARDALALLGGGLLVRIDGEQVAVDPHASLIAAR